jgi:hypothetical protein
MVSRGRLAGSFALPVCFILGIVAAAIHYMQNGQIVGQGFGAFADLFIRVAIISAVYTGVGMLIGGALAADVLKLRRKAPSK